MHFEDKLKELFRKHMDISSNRPGELWYKELCQKNGSVYEEPKPVSDWDFDEQFYHQLEYLFWSIDNDTVRFHGTIDNQPYTLLGLFVSQDDKLELIRKEFEVFLLQMRDDILKKIIKIRGKFHEQNIPCVKIYLDRQWSSLFETCSVLGMDLVEYEDFDNNIGKIESPEQYGKFVLIQ